MGRPGIGEKRLSHDRFHLLDEGKDKGSRDMAGDATIEIPLQEVLTRPQTGARSRGADAPIVSPEGSHSHQEKGFGGRRHRLTEDDQKLGSAAEDGTVNKMGKFYLKVLNFSVVTRYFIYVLPLALLIAIPIIIGATAAQNARLGGVRIVYFFSWVEILWCSLWVSKILAHFLPYAFQFLCGVVSSGTRKYALILRALEIPLSLVGWSVTSLATFVPIMTRNPDSRARGDTSIKNWQSVVQNILFAAFISTLILAAEKVLVQLISISYHRKQFEGKIQESKANVNVLTMLYDASRKLFPPYCPEFEDLDYEIADSIIAPARPGHRRAGSASPLRLIQGVGKVGRGVGDKITAAFGSVAQEITGKQVFNAGSAHSVVILALEKRKSSEALAKRLWMSFVLQGRDALHPDDLKEVFGAGNEEEAERCFAALDNDSNGDVSLEEMVLKVAEIAQARKSISKSMHDVDQAIHVLDNLLCTVVFILVILVFVAFLNKGFGTTLAAGATALLSLSFVFAVTAQEILGSSIFLFVKHPFDIGDRVHIADKMLIVERISLLYTIFRSVTDQRTVQVANIVLNTQWIDNISRSKAMQESFTLTVDFGTSFGDIQLLKKQMEVFLREQSRDFYPDINVDTVDLGKLDKLDLRIEIRHKSNWSNEQLRATRRAKFLCALVLAIRKIPIYGPGGGDAVLGGPSNPSYYVPVSDEEAAAKRDEFKAEKEGKRMIPSDEMDDVLLPSSPEQQPKATGSEPRDTSGGELKHRGGQQPTAAHQSAPSEEAFIEKLNSRSTAMAQPSLDDSGSTAAPVYREMSGRRKPSHPPQGPSPNTPAEYHEYATPFTTGSSSQPTYQAANPYAARPAASQGGVSYSAPQPPPGTSVGVGPSQYPRPPQHQPQQQYPPPR